MSESTIPVDLLNPGQVFACLGILEAADVLLGDASAAFDWSGGGVTTFRVAAAGTEPPIERVMRFLEDAEVDCPGTGGIAQRGRLEAKLGRVAGSRRSRLSVSVSGSRFARYPAGRSARCRSATRSSLEYWGDATRRDNVKFWAGSAGYPGAAIARDALRLVRGNARQHANDPFAMSGVQSNSFRFDWRRDYVPVQAGFSPNKHRKNIRMVGFPLVEVLAAVGMTHARPSRRTKLEYRYGVLGQDDGALFAPLFHRAALGASNPIPGRPFRRFVMHLDWPGKEGQARCITQVMEEEIDR